MNSPKRMIFKSFTWRVFALMVLFITTFIITGDIIHTSFISLAYNIIQIFTYFIHEYIWNKINFGRKI